MAAAPAAKDAGPALWRLDCGTIEIGNLNDYSDSYRYVGRQKTFTDSCYLIRNGDRYPLWDTGLPGELAGSTKENGGDRMTLRRTIKDQLAEIGVRPEQVTFVGISHYHYDHTGQAADFPQATLLVDRRDWDAIKGRPDRAEPFKPGHRSLLVRLNDGGPVLLSGDAVHFAENWEKRGVPGFNTSRAESLASMDRLSQIARQLNARLIIQYEPADIGKLPLFPKAAR